MGNAIRSGTFILLPTLLLAWTLPVSASGCFGQLPARVLLVGRPLDMASIDANRDGTPDLVVATVLPSIMTWRGFEVVTSDGAGGMTVTARIETPQVVGGLVTGDFNGDGFDDVATVPGRGFSNTALTLFVGDGAGGFSFDSSTPMSSNVGHSPIKDDFNGDGNLDLAVIGRSGVVNLFLGDGSGEFTVHDPELRFYAVKMAAADFDGDGIVDLALVGNPRSTEDLRATMPRGRRGRGILWNQSSRAPEQRTPVPGRKTPVGVSVRKHRVREKGSRVSEPTTPVPERTAEPVERLMQWLSIRLGDGEGGFVEQGAERIPSGTQALLVGDFNRDTVPDIAAAIKTPTRVLNSTMIPSKSTIGVLIGIGNGGFQELIEHEVTGVLSDLAAADVNRDGIIDLIGSGAGVLRGNGDGGFAPWQEIDILPGLVLVDDFSGDGVVDIVTAPASAPTGLTILKGDGEGGWSTPPTGRSVGEAVRAATSADFNKDGAPDVAALIEDNGVSRVVLLWNRAGALLPPVPLIVLGGKPLDIAAGDFNADGAADIALADPHTEQLAILHGDGVGGFRAGPVIKLGKPRTISVGDVNGDGQDDLVVTLIQDSSTIVLTEDGDGGLSTIARVRNGAGRQPVHVDDFDGDGHLDLLSVAMLSMASTLRLALSDGKGGFLPPVAIGVDHYPVKVILAQLDDDGRPDVVVTHGKEHTITFFLSSSGGLLGSPQTLSVRAWPVELAAGDFDGDGHDDVAVFGMDRSITFIPGAAERLEIATAVEAFSIRSVIAASDFDGDGYDDIAVVGPGAGDVTILGSCAMPSGQR